jgi:hypothetical protein
MNEPKWLTHARTYLGTAEIPGKQTAPVIARWLRELKSWWNDDEMPWCGTFVAAVLREACARSQASITTGIGWPWSGSSSRNRSARYHVCRRKRSGCAASISRSVTAPPTP